MSFAPPIPQKTGCTTLELGTEGLANGIISTLYGFGYDIEYDEESDTYQVRSHG